MTVKTAEALKDMSFEQAYSELLERYEKIEDSDTKLEEAISSYEELLVYYNRCMEVLEKAKGRIEEISARNE